MRTRNEANKRALTAEHKRLTSQIAESLLKEEEEEEEEGDTETRP